MIYRNRSNAGKILAAHLSDYAEREDVIVLALPRGGVPVAFEVAKILRAPFDIFLVRKLGVPGQEELAMGAISTGGVRVINVDVVDYLRIPETVIDSIAAEELHELERRQRAYRGDRSELDLRGKVVILIDDGLATGSTMRAAVAALRQQDPARIVVAVPVSAPQTCDEYRMGADEIICVVTPEPFYGVGQWYEDFSQTTDQEVRDLLRESRPGQSHVYGEEEELVRRS
jgi:putative phosphoribosyl transferase